jgi:hypothetical protein
MANTYIRLNLGGGAGGIDDKKVKVSSDDSSSGFLEEKVIVGSNKLTVQTLNPGTTEKLEIDIDQTQIDHDQLQNFDQNEHKPLNDAVTSPDSLWSSQKTQDELDTKVDKVSSTDNALSKFDGIEGQLQDTGIIVDDSNNVTGVNDLTIDGDLTVNGNTTTVNTSTLDVEDANVTLNKGGNQSSADLQGAGLTVDMSDATNAQIAYDSSLESKFKAGEVGSESEIVTVNDNQILESKTIDATSATGTNSISMDSDDVSYNNIVSGLFSNNVKEALDELNERDLFRQYHLYEDNALAFADADSGVIDPTGLDRDGWYYTNQNSGDKINWYYFDGTTQGTVTLGETSAYAVMEFDSAASTPILSIYTFPTGSGDIFPGFAHSRAVYSEPANPSIVAGQKYVVYFGENPNIHPELPRIELTYSSVNSIGDLDPSEPVLTISFGSNSAEPVGDVQYMVQELGLYSDPVKHNVELRIKKANESDLQTHINSTQAHDAIDVTYDNSSSGLVATDAQAAIDEVEDRLNTAESNISSNSSNLQTHLDDIDDAHTASAITNVPSGNLSATDLQSAVNELQSDIDGLSTSSGNVSEIFEVTNEPTGFADIATSAIAFDDVTYTLTISPVSGSFDFYVKGTKFTKSSAESIQIDNTQSGNHYFYYDENGVLSTTQVISESLFTENALISIVYWNPEVNAHIYFAEERHGLQMDGATHGYLHTTFGARYLSGHALENFTIGNGSLDSHAQFTADGGSIRDEDLVIQSPSQSQIPVLYRQGSLWRKKASDAFPFIYSGTAGYTGTNVPYNEFNGTSWQLTEAANNEFVLVHLFATNDKDNPIVAIQGTNVYNNSPDAKDAASTEISSLSGIPFVEFVAIGTVILKTSSSYGNSVKAKVEPIGSANYIDFRGTQLYTPAGEATTHSLLSGLLNDDHLQYHTDDRADIWYESKISSGDLQESFYSLLESQTGTNVTGLVFDPLVVRSFVAEISVEINASTNLYEKITIHGINKESEWDYTIESNGDDTLIKFSVNNNGQVQYSSNLYTGFIEGFIKFRAITTSV